MRSGRVTKRMELADNEIMLFWLNPWQFGKRQPFLLLHGKAKFWVVPVWMATKKGQQPGFWELKGLFYKAQLTTIITALALKRGRG